MRGHWAWIVPVVLAICGWVLPMFEGVQMCVRWVLIVVAGALMLLGAYLEAYRHLQRQRTDPHAVALDLERLSGMLAAFLREQARNGLPREFHDQAPEIRDPHEQRHVAYVREVVNGYERDVKPQILRHYRQARRIRCRDRVLEALLEDEILRIQQLWEISARLSDLSAKMSRRG